MRKIYKYPTGAEIPEGAIYLATIKNGRMGVDPMHSNHTESESNEWHSERCYVWHYFLVEDKD